MFNVGGGEILVIALIALIAVGPEQLPGVLRKIGNFAGQARQMSSALRSEFMSGMDTVNSSVDQLNPNNWLEERGDGSADSPIVPRGLADKNAQMSSEDGGDVSENSGDRDKAATERVSNPPIGHPDNPFARLPGTPGGPPASERPVAPIAPSLKAKSAEPVAVNPEPALQSAEAQFVAEAAKAVEETPPEPTTDAENAGLQEPEELDEQI